MAPHTDVAIVHRGRKLVRHYRWWPGRLGGLCRDDAPRTHQLLNGWRHCGDVRRMLNGTHLDGQTVASRRRTTLQEAGI